jgi:hypothetical protein
MRMIAAFDYASPSVFESDRDRALLGMSANARRPVRFHGRVTRNIPLFRFTLRALGEAIWSNQRRSGLSEELKIRNAKWANCPMPQAFSHS